LIAEKLTHGLQKNFNNEVIECYYSKRYIINKFEYDDIFYFLYDDLLVNFDTNRSIVRFLFKKTDLSKVESIIAEIRKFRERKTPSFPTISILVNIDRGIDTKTLQISKSKLSIEDNYNDDFNPIHEIILKRLSKKSDKGLILLHGKPAKPSDK